MVAAAQLNLDEVRKAGWLFDPSKGESGEPESWWKFYTYFGEPNSLSVQCRERFTIDIRLEPHPPGPSMVHVTHTVCSVCFLTAVCRQHLTRRIRSLFFNVLHPPLNVPALCKLCSCMIAAFII